MDLDIPKARLNATLKDIRWQCNISVEKDYRMRLAYKEKIQNVFIILPFMLLKSLITTNWIVNNLVVVVKKVLIIVEVECIFHNSNQCKLQN